jgi:GNAT superfamily N-acetyltransferase
MLAPIVKSDIQRLGQLQPVDWTTINPHFEFYIDSAICHPYKIELEGDLVAVGTIIYHQDTAWLAHIITHPNHRNRGLGTRMTSGLVQIINRNIHSTIYLIATEMGYPVYKKFGFELEGLYHHLIRKHDISALEASPNILPAPLHMSNQIQELDQTITGENRQQYIAKHIPSALVYLDQGNLQGVYFPTMGDGFILATNDVAGISLMRERFKDHRTAILPKENLAGLDFLKQRGFEITSTSRRMHLGPAKQWIPRRLYNRVSGQVG